MGLSRAEKWIQANKNSTSDYRSRKKSAIMPTSMIY